MSGGEIKTAEQARTVLGLQPGDGGDALAAAFRRKAKATHPDRGGDAAQFRLVIAAYSLLKAEIEGRAPPAEPPSPRPDRAHRPHRTHRASEQASHGHGHDHRPRGKAYLKISIVDAFLGGSKTIRFSDGRKGKIRLPAGLRSGDVLRFGEAGEHRFTISIRPEPRAEVRGDDLWLTVEVTQDFVKHGGRLEVDTPTGARKFWISRSSAARGLFRAPGEGLPETEAKTRGCLYLQMVAPAATPDSPSRSLLKRFASAWTG